jgi:hypothetical protein
MVRRALELSFCHTCPSSQSLPAGGRSSGVNNEPLYVVRAPMTLLDTLVPLQPMEVKPAGPAGGSAALHAYQGNRLVGTFTGVAGQRVQSLLIRCGRWIQHVTAEVRGSCVNNVVSIEMQFVGSSSHVLEGLRDAIDLWVRDQPVHDELIHARVKHAVERNGFKQDALRLVTLRHAVVAPTEHLLLGPLCKPESQPDMPVEVLLLTLYSLSLADACRLCLVCKKWNQAINGADELWQPLIWWNASLYAFVTR